MFLMELRRKRAFFDILHFVGIGGIGMSGLAEIMHNLGYKIQGSDITDNANTQRLSALGIKIYKGHAKENIEHISYLVVSSAINADNVEVIEARDKQIPVIRRAEMLSELMRLKCSIAVSGSHGKTTTTSLISCLFEKAMLFPTVINGGIINNRNTNAYLGFGDYLIAEADESDETFIHIPSTIGVITNIDPEHLDFYKTFDNLLNSFRNFILNLPFYGFAVVCFDHETVRNLVKNITERKIITYGIYSDDVNIKGENIQTYADKSVFDVIVNLPECSNKNQAQSHFTIKNIILPMPGKHNVMNALAAIAIAVELGFEHNIIVNGFSQFSGVKRRFTRISDWKNIDIIDDYAHHPVEVKATIATAKLVAEKKGGRVIAIFQPHRYSRVSALFKEFTHCFSDADIVYITDIYAAGEKPIEGISGKNLALAIKNIKKNNIFYTGENLNDEIEKIIKQEATSKDIVLIMGAGSISSIAAQIVQKLS